MFPLRAINVFSKCHGNPSNSCWDIKVWIREVTDKQTLNANTLLLDYYLTKVLKQAQSVYSTVQSFYSGS